jgi:hypothetical protein
VRGQGLHRGSAARERQDAQPAKGPRAARAPPSREWGRVCRDRPVAARTTQRSVSSGPCWRPKQNPAPVSQTQACVAYVLRLTCSCGGLPHGSLSPSSPPPQRTQNRRASAEQKAEVVPVSASCLVVERELLPAAEHVDDKDDPGRKPVPESPEQVCPPHDSSLLSTSLPVARVTCSSRTSDVSWSAAGCRTQIQRPRPQVYH